MTSQEFNKIIDSLLFPTQYAKTYTSNGTTYPPYNIIRLDETTTVIEIAVAGFKDDEINVIVEDGYLKITGKKSESETSTTSKYLYKGIGTRAFEKTFALSKDSKVESADYADGILSVKVSYEIPEEKKPKQIPVNRVEKLYLTE
jgi:molecular chaperone IbpA